MVPTVARDHAPGADIACSIISRTATHFHWDHPRKTIESIAVNDHFKHGTYDPFEPCR